MYESYVIRPQDCPHTLVFQWCALVHDLLERAKKKQVTSARFRTWICYSTGKENRKASPSTSTNIVFEGPLVEKESKKEKEKENKEKKEKDKAHSQQWWCLDTLPAFAEWVFGNKTQYRTLMLPFCQKEVIHFACLAFSFSKILGKMMNSFPQYSFTLLTDLQLYDLMA